MVAGRITELRLTAFPDGHERRTILSATPVSQWTLDEQLAAHV